MDNDYSYKNTLGSIRLICFQILKKKRKININKKPTWTTCNKQVVVILERAG